MLPEKTRNTALSVKRAGKVALFGIVGAVALLTTIQIVQFVLGALPFFIFGGIGLGVAYWYVKSV